MSICCPLVVRLLFDYKTDNKRTTSGQQTDISRSHIGVIWVLYGTCNQPIARYIPSFPFSCQRRCKWHQQSCLGCPRRRPQSPATDHRLPTAPKYIVHDINLFLLASPPAAVIQQSKKIYRITAQRGEQKKDIWMTPSGGRLRKKFTL